MAPINQINDDSQDYSNLLGSWGATICLMAGMVISLLGIKIWWFKHRLSFEQNTAPNIDSRGSQPVLRTNIKDKRQSQQVSDSVVVHGIFRKRNEDELEVFERPRQLPPVRVPERSMSTTALMPPPRTRRGNLTPDIIPPIREAPSPTNLPSTPPTPTISVHENIYVEPQTLRSQSSPQLYAANDASDEKPAPERLFQKVRPTAERKAFEKHSTERRATGFLSPTETQDLETLLIQSTEQANVPETTPKEVLNMPGDTVEVAVDNPIVELFFKDLESIEDSDSEKDYEQRKAYRSSRVDNYFQSSTDTATDSAWNDVPLTATEPIYAVAKRTSKVKKLTDNGYEEQTEVQQVETHFSWQATTDSTVDNNDYQVHSQEEFEKRRQSYQEHEGHFLELNEPLNQPQSPTGYGKNIDEDWENFQDLRTTTFTEIDTHENWDATAEEALPTSIQFEFNELQTVNAQHAYRTQQNTAYVQSIEELYDELSDMDDEQANSIIITHSVKPPQKSSILKERLSEFASSGYDSSTGRAHKLKAQQKVTFDVHTEEYYLPESETDTEDENEEEENDNNYNNKNGNYIVDDEDDDGYDDNFRKNMPQGLPPPLPTSAMPTPMQRTTKMQYAIEEIETTETSNSWHNNTNSIAETQVQHKAALLFSTQISLDNDEASDDFDTNNDSWAAIRQRRYQNYGTEETHFQAIPRSSPRPAHRTPLAEQTQIQPAPRTRRGSTEA